MNIRCQIFIIVVIVYTSYGVLAFENYKCTCDILHMNGGWFGNQNFTKQTYTRNRKPVYFSTQLNMISWNNQRNQWSYERYDLAMRKFRTRSNHGERREIFSFDNMCEKMTWKGQRDDPSTWIHSECLIDDSNCSFSKELTRKFMNGNIGSQVQLQAKNPCKFPFI